MGGGIETDYNPPAYFVLVLITRGVFDDLKETVQVSGNDARICSF
jgi:hypothetical protein